MSKPFKILSVALSVAALAAALLGRRAGWPDGQWATFVLLSGWFGGMVSVAFAMPEGD